MYLRLNMVVEPIAVNPSGLDIESILLFGHCGSVFLR